MPHMNRLRTPAILSVSVLLIACVSPPQFTGDTQADEALRKDISRTILVPLRILNRCSGEEKIATRVVKVNPPVAGASNDFVRLGTTYEHWIVGMCGQRYAYQILLAPSPRGGTDFSVRPMPLE